MQLPGLQQWKEVAVNSSPGRFTVKKSKTHMILFLACLLARSAPAEEVTETQKILVLISAVEALGSARFMKDGAEITCIEAAKWMREDLALQGKVHPAAHVFVKRVSGPAASPYWIATRHGQRLIVRDFLLQTLAGMDTKPPGAE